MLEIIIPSIVPIVLTGITTLIINFLLQRKARKHDFQLVTYESLEEENKELRKENFNLQQQVLELAQVSANLKSDINTLSNENDELAARVEELSRQLLVAKEEKFQLYSEVEVMKKQLYECQEYIRKHKKRDE